MFFRLPGVVDLVCQCQFFRFHRAVADFAAADALALLPALLHQQGDILPQARVAIAFHHQRGGDIANDAVDPAEARHVLLDVRDERNKRVFGIRLILARLPVSVKFRVLEQLAGVNLEFVRLQASFPPQLFKVFPVALRACPKQIRHPVQHHLVASRSNQRDRGFSFRVAMPAPVFLQDFIIHTLYADLDFRHALPAQFQQTLQRDEIRACLDHKPHITVDAVHIARLHLRQRDLSAVIERVFLIERLKTAPDKPLPVVGGIRRPGPAQNKQFYLFRRVPHFVQRLQPRTDLQEGVKVVFHPAPRAGLSGKIRLRQPLFAGAKNALTGTGMRLGEDGDGRHAGERAYRLHPNLRQQHRIVLPLTRLYHAAVSRHQGMLGKESPASR